MSTTPSPRIYMGHTLFPVLDDETGQLDYWDVHHPLDPHGEGDPLAEGFSTLSDAQSWVRERKQQDRLMKAIDRFFN